MVGTAELLFYWWWRQETNYLCPTSQNISPLFIDYNLFAIYFGTILQCFNFWQLFYVSMICFMKYFTSHVSAILRCKLLEVARSKLNKLPLERGHTGNKIMCKSTCLINSQLKQGGRILSGTPMIRLKLIPSFHSSHECIFYHILFLWGSSQERME